MLRKSRWKKKETVTSTNPIAKKVWPTWQQKTTEREMEKITKIPRATKGGTTGHREVRKVHDQTERLRIPRGKESNKVDQRIYDAIIEIQKRTLASNCYIEWLM